MSRRRAALVAAVVLAACAGAGICLRLWGLSTLRIAGTSMADTLLGGDVALVTRFDYAGGGPSRGDVVQCIFPERGDTYVKRVIGLPGESVAFRGGALYIDGAAVPETYLSSPTEDFAIVLGPDEYLALGDNRAASYDSRMADMGPVGRSAFLGRVRWILWPLGRFGPVD